MALHKEFTIYGKVESLNKTILMHWAVRNRAVRAWHKKVTLTCGMNFGPPIGPVQVRFLVHRARPLDSDNLQGGSMKAIRDGIKRCGWMRDDSPAWATFQYSQMRCPKGKERVDVVIDA